MGAANMKGQEVKIMSRNFLSKNDELRRGDFLISNNREFKAIFQDDGNFVIYGWKPLWASDTHGTDAVRLCMQADCNLVMYNKNSEPRWHTNSARPSCNMCSLRLTDDGKLVVHRECDAIWSSAESRGMNLTGVGRSSLIMSRNFLSKNDELRRGDFLISNNGEFKAIFQDDGNFVIYGWKPLWASDTHGTDAVRLCMQADCNLVMYNKNSEPRWHTNTSKPSCNMCRLHLTDDGKLVVHRECDAIWSSAESRGMK
ncbi:hypothetical protein L3Q82_004659 [Scortum barcoo]|uniref:Uncharacterized protein n=1 Tax=Scortum barcoo TaxID=214431 RepID=A0ACB8VH08_9TELE|nr:hypothetical protein L3Q82_004659 [Scortum barcoo]